MDFYSYIENAEKPNNFTPSGVTKNDYLDVIEICVMAYDKKTIEDRLPAPGEMVDDIHAYSRIACGIAALLSNGRIPEYKELWISMMDALCNDFYRQSPPSALDFALKETMLGFKSMKPYISKEKQSYWLELLGRIDPEKCFNNTSSNYSDWFHIRNWNIYAMAGYWLLETEGHADSAEFFDKYWDHQFKYFDDMGMYMDPYNPILYDLTTRVQAQLIPAYGYRGKHFEKLNENLKKGALTTLFYQSAAFELPFGGRSNQYLFNESLLTSNFEYEASRWKKEGNIKLAGMYKRAAHLAIKSISKWLEAEDGARHTKNFFPTKSKYGVEGYGYYDKYMMTMGVFLFIGLPFSDDTIEEFPCPAELGGYVFETTDNFHKIFASSNSYSIEIDPSGDFFYDATGLGRIHKNGAPSELALSAPSGQLHDYRYKTEGCITTDLALTPGWDFDGEIRYLASASNKESHSFSYVKNNFETSEEFEEFKNKFNNGLMHELLNTSITPETTKLTINYAGEALKGIAGVSENYTITKDGIELEVVLKNPTGENIYFLTPAFITNGRDTSNIDYSENCIIITSMGWIYTVKTDGVFLESSDILGNRNGKYKRYTAVKKSDSIRMTFSLEEKLTM